MSPARRKQGQESEANDKLQVPPIRSEAARQVARWFSLPLDGTASRARAELPADLDLPAAGEVMLITGPSGAGKSSLLRALLARAARRRDPERPAVLRADRLRLAPVPCVDQFGPDVHVALDLLNSVGLGEACTYLRLPSELSDGQRWRLRLAAAIFLARARPTGAVLVADEFCAVLDRVSAAVVARSLRRAIDRPPVRLSAVVVTSHDDLAPALCPDVVVRCDFGSTQVQASLNRKR